MSSERKKHETQRSSKAKEDHESKNNSKRVKKTHHTTSKKRKRNASSSSVSSSSSSSSSSTYQSPSRRRRQSRSNSRTKVNKRNREHNGTSSRAHENGYSKKTSSRRRSRSRSPDKKASKRHGSPSGYKRPHFPQKSSRYMPPDRSRSRIHIRERKKNRDISRSITRSPIRQRKSSRHYSSSTSSSSRSITPVNHSSLGSLVGIAPIAPPQALHPSMMFIQPQIQQPLPPGVHSPTPPPPPGETPSIPPPPPPTQGQPPPPQQSSISFSLRPPVYNPMASYGIHVGQDIPFPFSPAVPPPSFVPTHIPPPFIPSSCIRPPAVPPPPPPPPPSTNVVKEEMLSSTAFTSAPSVQQSALSSSLAEMHVQYSASASSSRLSHTRQLPLPPVGIVEPVLVRPEYTRPVIFNKRQLPEVSENWGIGTLSNYKIVAQVGEGTYGQVYKATKRGDGSDSQSFVALKKVRLENEREGFPITAIREIKILRQLDHKNVVKLLDIVTDKRVGDDKQTKKDIGSFYLVFEYVDHDLNGLLDSNMVEFTQVQIASLFKQLLLALEHCHQLNFLHRDIKCANILINNSGQLKLADFGLARLYLKDVERLYTNRVITLWYRPPELLLGQEKYNTEVDIWSAGCILGELFVKKPIFQGNVEQAQLEIIAQYCGSPSAEVWPGVVNLPNYKTMRLKNYYPRRVKEKFAYLPPPALDLLDKLLQLDPKRRPSATEALNHHWLINIEPDNVPPPELPRNQDCHEMWSKKMKASRNQKQQHHNQSNGSTGSGTSQKSRAKDTSN